MNVNGLKNKIVLRVTQIYDFYRGGDEILVILCEKMLIDKN